MRAIEFIFESYPLAKKEFSRVANPSVVQATIDQYRELVRKNQFRNPAEKNINYWRERGWEAFSQMVKVKSNDVTDTQLKKGKAVGNAITLQDDAEWVVLIPLDKETSVHYGKDTEWCTTKPYWAYFEEYVYERNITLIYAIDKTKAGRSVAISIEPDTDEGEKINMFNQADDPIDANEYTNISGLDSAKFIQIAKLPKNQQQLNASIDNYKVARESTRSLLRAKPLDPEAIERELKFTKNADDCYEYILAYGQEQHNRVRVHPSIVAAVSTHDNSQKVKNVGQYIDFTSIPLGVIRSIFRTAPNFIIYNATALSPNQQVVITEYETKIKTSIVQSYEYAEKANKPFPAGEAVIATDAYYSYLYAKKFFKDVGWPAGEAAIAKDAKCSYMYANNVLADPFPAGEDAIATSAEYSYHYAYFVRNEPFPAGEAAIAQHPGWACKYALHICAPDPFPAGEAAIARDAGWAYQYADRVLGKPFPAGEAVIAKDARLVVVYKNRFGIDLLSKYAESIKDDPKKAFDYAYNNDEPFPDGEAAIATSSLYSYAYAHGVLDKPFPLGEPAIATSAEYSCKYAASVLKKKRFPAGEAAIATSAEWSYTYAANVLKTRFPAGEAAIATNPTYAKYYDEKFGTNLSQQ